MDKGVKFYIDADTKMAEKKFDNFVKGLEKSVNDVEKASGEKLKDSIEKAVASTRSKNATAEMRSTANEARKTADAIDQALTNQKQLLADAKAYKKEYIEIAKSTMEAYHNAKRQYEAQKDLIDSKRLDALKGKTLKNGLPADFNIEYDIKHLAYLKDLYDSASEARSNILNEPYKDKIAETVAEVESLVRTGKAQVEIYKLLDDAQADVEESSMKQSQAQDRLAEETRKRIEATKEAVGIDRQQASTSYDNFISRRAEEAKQSLAIVEELRQELAEVEATKQNEETTPEIEKVSEEIQRQIELVSNLASQQEQVANNAVDLKDEYVSAVEQASSAYHKAEDRVARVQAELEMLRNGETALPDGMISSEIKNMEAQLEKELDNLTTEKEKFEEAVTAPDSLEETIKNIRTDYDNAVEGARNLIKTLHELQGEQAVVEESAKHTANALLKAAADRQKAKGVSYINKDDSEAPDSSPEIISRTVEKSTEKTARNVKDVASHTRRATGHADALDRILRRVNSFTKTISRHFGNIYNRIRHSKNHAGGLFKVFDKLSNRLWRMAKNVFVFNMITKAFRTLRQLLSNIFNNDEEMSNYFGRIKANLLTAFAPLYEVALPTVRMIMSVLADATQRFAQFVSSLFGYSFAQAQEAAKKLLHQAKAAKKETESLNKTLGHLDELNQDISTENKNATEDDLAGFVWDEEKWFDKIDPYELGERIGNALTEALDNIPWNDIKSKAKEVGTNLALFLDGFISPELFGAIGRTAAEFINTKMQFFNGFLHNFDFEDLGNSIVSGLRNFFETLEWDTIRDNAREAFKGLATTLGIIASDPTLWADLGDAIANMILTIIDGWYSFVTNFPFKEFGKNIGNAINQFLEKMAEIDADGLSGWQRLGASITKTATGILEFLIEGLKSVDWIAFGQALGEFINSIDWKKVIVDFGTLAMNILTAIGNAIMGLGAENPLAAAIVSAILIGMTASKLAPVAAAIKSGLGIGGGATVAKTVAGSGVAEATGAGVAGGAVAKTSLFTKLLGVSTATVGGAMIGKGLGEILAYEFGSEEDYKAYRDFTWGEFFTEVVNLDSWKDFWSGVTDDIVDNAGKMAVKMQRFNSAFGTAFNFVLDTIFGSGDDEHSGGGGHSSGGGVSFRFTLEELSDKVKEYAELINSTEQSSDDMTAWYSEMLGLYTRDLGYSYEEATRVLDSELEKQGIELGLFKKAWEQHKQNISSEIKSAFTEPLDKVGQDIAKCFGFDDANSFGNVILGGIGNIATKISQNTAIQQAFANIGATSGQVFAQNLANMTKQMTAVLDGTPMELSGGLKAKLDRMGKLSTGNIMGLASGTVVPASSREFLAVLGDNNTETEVVSPLSTMKEALMEALAAYGGLGGEQQIILQVDGNDLFRWLVQKNKETYLQTGQNMLIY